MAAPSPLACGGGGRRRRGVRRGMAGDLPIPIRFGGRVEDDGDSVLATVFEMRGLRDKITFLRQTTT